MNAPVENKNYVVCQICNCKKKELNYHMKKMHNITIDEYKIKYPNATIICEESSIKKSQGTTLGHVNLKASGYKVSDETKKRNSAAGKKLHEKWKEEDYEGYMQRQQLYAGLAREAKGDDFKHSPETIEKMKGPRLCMQGVPKTEEHKQKLSISKTGISNGPHKSETIEKMKKAWDTRKQNIEEYEKYISLLSKNRKEYIIKNGISVMKTSSEPNKLEQSFIDWCNKNKIDFKYEYLLVDRFYDFYLPQFNMLVELDGEYWHTMEHAIINDIYKTKLTINNNIPLLRISTEQASTLNQMKDIYDKMFLLSQEQSLNFGYNLIEKRLTKLRLKDMEHFDPII